MTRLGNRALFAAFTSPIATAVAVSLIAHMALLAGVLNAAYLKLTDESFVPPENSIRTTLVTISAPPQPDPDPDPAIAESARIPAPPVIPPPLAPAPPVEPTPIPATRPEVVEKIVHRAVAPSIPKQAIAKPRPKPKPQPKPAPRVPSVQVDEPRARPFPNVESSIVPEQIATASEADKSTPAMKERVLHRVITRPGYRSEPTPPRYPRKARRKRQQGTAWIRVLVATDGANLEVKLHRSSGYDLLDQAALDAVTSWQFQPASVAGEFVVSWVEVPVEFKLR